MDSVTWQAKQPGPTPAAIEGTYAVDGAFPDALHDALAAGFARLADPEAKKDWHPGSDEQARPLITVHIPC